ncbi:heavy metal transporter [Streptomyces sp. O3]
MSEQPSSSFGRGRLLRTGAAVAVLLALAGYLAAHYAGGGRPSPRCVVVSAAGDGATYEFGVDQAVNAATISAVGTSRGMPERAVTIALATALQESGLRNIDYGDRDSLGLFQQRPSQGWGTRKQIMDPAYAAGEFYEHLAEIPGYTRLPLTDAAQRVQRSGFPQAYAKHEPDATLLAAALTGRAAASLTCGVSVGSASGDATRVREALVRDFGRDVLPRTGAADDAKADAKGGGAGDAGDASAAGDAGDAGRAAGAADPSRTVAVPVPAADGGDGADARRGWEVAQWAVAQSSVLHIERVAYAGREWTGEESGRKWRKTNGRAEADEVLIVMAR